MKNYLLDILICSSCKTPFGSAAKETDTTLVCTHCKKKWTIKNNRPILTDTFENYEGILEANPSIIRERLEPKIYDFTFLMTRSHRETFGAFVAECTQKPSPLAILDIGCGFKPFSHLFSPKDQYIGTDISMNSYADVISNNHYLPFKENSFDAVIASEVLEHALNEYQFIEELRRVSKPGALLFLSLPFVFPEHGTPFDYQRLTKYKLEQLFARDTILTIKETNNFISTCLILPNIFLKSASTTKMGKLFYPFFIVTNILGLLNERLWKSYLATKERRNNTNPYLIKILNSCPLGYGMIVKIKK